MIYFILYAFFAACLEMAFQEYQQPRMIFDWYRIYLIKISKGKNKSLFIKKLALVFGLCPYCNGFWVSLIIYLIIFQFNFIGMLLFTGLNYFFIELIIKLKN